MTLPDEQRDQLRGYLRTQAAERSIEELVERVEQAAGEVETAARAVPDEAFDTVPPGETWTPQACLSHVVDWTVRSAQQVLFVALTGALPEPSEVELPTDRDGLLAKQREALDSLYEHLRSADPQNFVEIQWKHEIFGDLNWKEWLLFLRVHFKDHSGQLAAMAVSRQ
jgi:hypothetical protein